MRGEPKSGLSINRIKIRHGKIVFDNMLDRNGKMDLNDSSSIDIFGLRKTPKKKCHDHYELLTYKYGKHHLKKSDMDQLQCCTFALGVNCEQINQENSCIKCLTCF